MYRPVRVSARGRHLMGVLKYAEPMECRAYVRLTGDQANSLTHIAHAMSLTVGDLLRFAVDELIEDVPEVRVFSTRLVTIARTNANGRR